jgi:DEAD/DEAH box helicase domain-containing protein
VPDGLTSEARELLNRYAASGLYAHQADALSHVVSGRSVVVSTPTASGKSLTFIPAALHVLTSERSSRVLALYPTEALIRDQLAR